MASDRPLRVLYVESNFDGTVGGSFFSLYYLVSGLDRSRFEPIVIFSADNPLVPQFQDAGIETRIIRLPAAIRLPTAPGRLVAKAGNLLLGAVLTPWRLSRLMRRERISLVHLNNSIIKNHEWMMASRMAGIPCVTHERGINAGYLKRALTLGRGLAAVICISDAVRDNFEARQVHGLNLVTIPNGLDPAAMQPGRDPHDVRRELGIPSDAPLVVMVGNIKPWKGQEVLIRAIARLKERLPDIACLLVGDSSLESSDYHRRMRELVATLGIGRNVHFLGYRRHVADYINAAHILVHASILPEPFGRVLLEGMAMSKPVVASRDGAVPEIVVEGATGLLFETGDDGGLAECLDRLIRDPARATQMGQAGHRRLVEHFTAARNAESTQRLYDSILRKPGRRW